MLGVRGWDVWREGGGRWVGGVITYDPLSSFFTPTLAGRLFLLVEKSRFFKNEISHQVSFRGRYRLSLKSTL